MIEIDALRKNYRGVRGLNGFSLRMDRGDLVGLVGPNGAGKSTLIKILATLLPADSGSARVSGEDVAKTPAAVRSAVGYLPDVPGVYQDMRIGEFLEFFADAFRLKEPGRSAAVERALCLAGLADRRDDFVEHLSLGWKQRLHLAKTLLHGPRVLLLDEPATGLDPLARIALREQLRQLHAAGITILISSHILADLEDICTRIVFIADGKNVSEVQPAASVHGAMLHCEIEWEGSVEAAERFLAAIPGAAILEKKGNWRRIELPGGAPQASSLLRGLLDAGLTVLHFDARGPGLEERYRRTFGGPRP
ncbi:MAG: ABC transporter ATP-binding protein [Acidobacteriia bacterium]|nr:ABC transporter ATP-binding protein [Terriglobia bacterium]